MAWLLPFVCRGAVLYCDFRAIEMHPWLVFIRQLLRADGKSPSVGTSISGKLPWWQQMTRALYDAGLWAMFAGFDTSVLQFKAGLLVDAAYCDEALTRLEDGMRRCVAGLG